MNKFKVKSNSLPANNGRIVRLYSGGPRVKKNFFGLNLTKKTILKAVLVIQRCAKGYIARKRSIKIRLAF